MMMGDNIDDELDIINTKIPMQIQEPDGALQCGFRVALMVRIMTTLPNLFVLNSNCLLASHFGGL